MPKVRVNGVEIAYSDNKVTPHHEGDAPVVLIHGFPYNKSMWDDQIKELDEFRIITYDLRGHGDSGSTPGPYTMELLADDLKGLLDVTGLQKIALGGFSMGGYVALAFMRKYADRVQSLLLLDTKATPDGDAAKKGREDVAQQVEKDGVKGLSEALPGRMLAPDTVANNPKAVAKARDMILKASPQGVAASARGMALRPDSTDLLSRIAVPTLVLVGELDGVTPPAESDLMASKIKGAQMVKIPGASHLSNLDKPEEFSHAVHDFFHPH